MIYIHSYYTYIFEYIASMCYNKWLNTLKVLQLMKKYTKIKVLRISETQDKSLKKMKSWKVDVSQFCRNAIKEKIDREYSNLIPKVKEVECPF